MNEMKLYNIKRAIKKLPEVSGVYIYGEALFYGNLIIPDSVLYVGVSKNIKNRLKQHLAKDEANIKLRKWLSSLSDVIYVGYYKIDSKIDYLDLEKKIISSSLDPMFNTKHRDKKAKNKKLLRLLEDHIQTKQERGSENIKVNDLIRSLKEKE